MKQKTYDELADELTSYMKNELGLKDSSIYIHHLRWRKLKEYMLQNNIKFFTSEIATDYLFEKLGDDYSNLSNNDKTVVSNIKDLMQFYETAYIDILPQEEPSWIGNKSLIDFLNGYQ